MSQTEGATDPDPGAAGFIDLVKQHIGEAESDLQAGERLLVMACTPEGRVEATHFDCLEPNVLVVHGMRGGRRTIIIAPLGLVQVAIESIPQPPAERTRHLGFRLD